MHLCRPGPWARPGGGRDLEIRRVARRMPTVVSQPFHVKHVVKNIIQIFKVVWWYSGIRNQDITEV
jgi:hypothetical protein